MNGITLVENEQGQFVPVLNEHIGLAIDDVNAWIEGTRTLAQWGSNTYIRAFGENQNDTLLAVPLFVLMGIALERSKIAEELLTSMGKLLVVHQVFSCFSGCCWCIIGSVYWYSWCYCCYYGINIFPTMLKAGYSKPPATGVIATSGTLGQVIPPSIVLVLLGAMVGDIY